MKGKYILFAIILLISGLGFSQVAGYMGKRFIIGYDMYFFPAIKGPGGHNAGQSSEFNFGINNAHCINIDYTIKQRTNLCLSFQYLQTGIAYRKFGAGPGSILGEDVYPAGIVYHGDYSIPAKLSSFNLGLGFKFFKAGSIAPLGRYQKLELLLFFETVTYNNKKFDQNGNSLPQLGTGTYNFNNCAVTYTLGKQRIFFDKLVLDYGFRMGLAFVPAFSELFSNSNASSNSFIIERAFQEDAGVRLLRDQLINFHIGIGFLAF